MRPALNGRVVAVAAVVFAGGAAGVARGDEPADEARAAARHVLNRMAFGPRPGQVEQVVATGVDQWVARQLRPQEIPEGEIGREVAELAPCVFLSLDEIVERYRPAYTQGEPVSVSQKRNRLRTQIKRELADAVLHRAVHSPRQFEEVVVHFWRNHFSIDQDKGAVALMAPHFESSVLRAHAFGKFEDMLLASARHPAMLTYLDNVLSQKPLTENEERLVERFGGKRHVPRIVAALGRERGLNENYARELMEMHTLGVDRRYRQRDVTELSRVLTGWSGRLDNEGGSGFVFRGDVHDDGAKWLFGTRLRGEGEDQGVAVIRGLARHRLTADFIARKLCAYLVEDEPDERLVRRVAAVFTRTKGDLPEVYEAVVTSPEFRAAATRRVKFKTPFEFVVSALRATGAAVQSARRTQQRLAVMGQETYRCLDPDGYSDAAEAWLDPGVLVHRWEFAWDLAHGDLPGVRLADRALGSEGSAVMRGLLALPRSPDTWAAVEAARAEGGVPQVLAILLGSPEFMQQ